MRHRAVQLMEREDSFEEEEEQGTGEIAEVERREVNVGVRVEEKSTSLVHPLLR